jgi:hypothetical protein
MLIISAIGVAAAVLRANGSDSQARSTLQAVVGAVQTLRDNTPASDGGGFASVTGPVLERKIAGLSVVDSPAPSTGDHVVSMTTYQVNGSYGWYGAVRAKSGRCYAAAINGTPTVDAAILPGNCTGDAARASLMPLASTSPSMRATVAPSGSTSGTG